MTQRKIVHAEYQMPFYFATDLSDLIYQMLQLDPAQRITIDHIVDHPWMIHDEEVYSDEEETCLTPSSSTTTNQSDLDSICSQQDHPIDDNLNLPYDLKFSPQVRSSLGILRPSTHQQQMNKSPRFSAPSLNRRSPSPTSFQHSYRSSLPSSFHHNRETDTSYMSPIEQKLFAALTTAGFDKDALIKMQTGECDTSSTLWHLLLENMSSTDQPIASVPDAFASAIKSRNNKQTIDRAIQTGVEEHAIQTGVDDRIIPAVIDDRAIQTDVDNHITQSGIDTTLTMMDYSSPVQPYPKPVTSRPIQTVGFGSTTSMNEKSGWFTSVKSWFGSKQQQQQQQLQLMQQQNELIIKHQEKQRTGRPLSNCSTMSSPISSPSSYRNFDTTSELPDGMMMSPPIYRTGSQKYRRRVLQLSQPPVSELDQLTYNGTYPTNTLNTTTNQSTLHNHYHAPQSQLNIHQVNMPPTALTTRSLVADSFSILNSSCQPKEIDICEKRYSMMYRPQLTPPPSPPVEATHTLQQEQVEQESMNNLHCEPISPMNERTLIALSTHSSTNDLQEIKNNLSDFSSDSSDDCSSISDCEETIAPAPVSFFFLHNNDMH